jgi:hypothetical protein
MCKGIIGEEPLRLPFKMFGDKQAACVDEVMFALTMLREKTPTWYEYVLKHTKSIECKTGEPISYAQPLNVLYNMIFTHKPVRPEAMIVCVMTDRDLAPISTNLGYHLVRWYAGEVHRRYDRQVWNKELKQRVQLHGYVGIQKGDVLALLL